MSVTPCSVTSARMADASSRLPARSSTVSGWAAISASSVSATPIVFAPTSSPRARTVRIVLRKNKDPARGGHAGPGRRSQQLLVASGGGGDQRDEGGGNH